MSKEDRQTILIDDSEYPENSEMQYVIKKLMMASASADPRRQMDVEEEFFSEIDSRDAKLKALGKKVDEQKQALEQKDKKLYCCPLKLFQA